MQRRRLAGLTIAIALIVACSAYVSWRMASVSREGWAGFAYMPDVKTKSGKAPPSFGPYRPGMVFMVYPGSPAEDAGIGRLTRILSINGIPIGDMKRIAQLADGTHRGSVAVYRTDSNGAIRDHKVRFESPTSSPLFTAVMVVTVIVALTYLLIGTFVFWRLPTDSRAVVFFVMTLFAATSFMASIVAQFEARSLRGFAVETKSAAQLIGPALVGVVSLFFAPLLLHLALIFPKPRPVVRRAAAPRRRPRHGRATHPRSSPAARCAPSRYRRSRRTGKARPASHDARPARNWCRCDRLSRQARRVIRT